MRAVMLAATAFVLAVPAYAGVITVAAYDDGLAVPLVCAGGVNAAISCSGGSVNHASINIGAAGSPPAASPADLASLNISATSLAGGTHTLDVRVFQTGIALPPPIDTTSTFTINHLTGGAFGPSTLSTYYNGTVNTLGTLLASHVFPAGDVNDTVLVNAPIGVGLFADAMQYVVQTTAAGQVMTDTIQLHGTEVTEPTGLALLGMSLLGLGMVRARRS